MTEITLFQFIGEAVANATAVFVEPVATKLMSELKLTAMLGVYLYIVTKGFFLVLGYREGSISEAVLHGVKIIIIAFFAFTVDGYVNGVMAALNGLETGLSDLLNASSVSPSDSIYQTLDRALDKGFKLAALCLERSSEAGWNFGPAASWWTAAVSISLGTLVFALIGGVNIIIAKFSLAIMFALGPLFILCLMFPITAKFFDGWIGQVLNYMFTLVVLALIVSFGVGIFDAFVNSVDLNVGAEDAQNPFMVSLQVLGLTGSLGWIAMQASNMASGLAGGMSMAMMSIRQMTAPARGAARGVQKAAQLGHSAGKGMYAAGQSAASHLGGARISNAAPPKPPAYNQHFLKMIQRPPKNQG